MQDPSRLVKQIKSKYPDCWKFADGMRREYAQNPSMWPGYCYMPLLTFGRYLFPNTSEVKGKIDAIREGHLNLMNLTEDEVEKTKDLSALGALASWRMTKGVYRFDPELYSALVKMEVEALPSEVLHHLPEWCVYIELQNNKPPAQAVGVFVHIEYDVFLHREEIRLVFDTTGNISGLEPVTILLSNTLEESLRKSQARLNEPDMGEHSFDLHSFVSQISGQAGLSGIFSLILYLCSVNADLELVQSRRKPQGKKTPVSKMKPAETESIWQVGYRIGPVLKQDISLRSDSAAHAETGRTVRPHIRRAHWHHFWKGPMEKRELILKWIPPVAVRVENPDELPATVRPVQ